MSGPIPDFVSRVVRLDTRERVLTHEALVGVLDRISFAPNVAPLFGSRLERTVRDVYAGDPAFPGAIPSLAGWLVTFLYEKASSGGNPSAFAYTLEVFVGHGWVAERVLELVLDKCEFFLKHELREGFLYEGKPAFEPHR